jgi:hypothetical protein
VAKTAKAPPQKHQATATSASQLVTVPQKRLRSPGLGSHGRQLAADFGFRAFLGGIWCVGKIIMGQLAWQFGGKDLIKLCMGSINNHFARATVHTMAQSSSKCYRCEKGIARANWKTTAGSLCFLA